MKLLKKITVKTANDNKRITGFGEDDKIGKTRIVLTVWGRADKFEEGENTMVNGDVSKFVKFRGSFAAIPAALGERTTDDEAIDERRSGVLIMPDVAADLLRSLLQADDVQSVNFGFAIGITKTESSVGYEYFAKPLIEEGITDPLAAITAALPAPKQRKTKAAGGTRGARA